MRILKHLLFLAVLFLTISCNENRVYDQFTSDFSNFVWEKQEAIHFSPNITDATAQYELRIALRHVHGFRVKTLQLKAVITAPSGTTTTQQYNLPVFNNKGEYISECAGDYCDLEVLVEPNLEFPEAGTYQYDITYENPTDKLPNLMQVGLFIDKQVPAKK